MDFRILGPLEVRDGERFVEVGAGKQRTLLGVLLLHAGEAVSADRLIEVLWPGDPPASARNSLHIYVSQLRKALGDGRLIRQGGGYRLSLEPDELDARRFEALVRKGRELHARANPEDAAQTLRSALELWRGPPLADFTYEPFAQTEIARFEELRLTAVEERIEADLELGRHVELVPELEALVREHPLRERLRGQLMLALYRCGRQADALEAYRAGRRLLDEELGLEPGEEIRRLERAILEQDPALAAEKLRASPPEAAVPTGTVTFLFTDIAASTRLVTELGDDYGDLLDQHQRLLREAFEEHGGREIDTQGDAFFFAFRRAREAVAGAVAAQRTFASATWPGGVDVRVRIGIHTGEPALAAAGYHGLDVVRAARISDSAHGGQILVSSATRDLVGVALESVSFLDLGEHRLKGIREPQRVFQVLAPGLSTDFAPPRTVDAARGITISGREAELAAAAEAAIGAQGRRARLSRRSRLAALAGALLLGGAIAGALVAVTRGSGGSAVAVAPDSVAVIDPKANRVVAQVPVGGRPIDIVTGLGAVWIANSDDSTVLRVDPKTHRETRTIGVRTEVAALAVGAGSVWVAGGNDSLVTRIRPDGTVRAIIPFPAVAALGANPVFSVAVGDGIVWAAAFAGVYRIDPATNSVRKVVALSDPPITATATREDVWVLLGRTTEILRISRAFDSVDATLRVGEFPAGLAAGAGGIWVADAAGVIWRIDPATNRAGGSVRIGGGPSDVGVGGSDLVWSANADDGTVSRIDSRTERESARVRTGHHPIAIASGYGAVWIGVSATPPFTPAERGGVPAPPRGSP